jgi:hypothetical protein
MQALCLQFNSYNHDKRPQQHQYIKIVKRKHATPTRKQKAKKIRTENLKRDPHPRNKSDFLFGRGCVEWGGA